MSKKLTYEEVKNFIEGEEGNGCILLTEEYINSQTKMKIQCKCGNIFFKNFNKFKHGNEKRCNGCAGKKDWDINSIKNFIEIESESGCKLLSNEFKNFKTLLKIQCKCGNIFNVNFNKFKDVGQRQCPECRKKNQINKKTHSHRHFIKRVYGLVGCEYVPQTIYRKANSHILMKHTKCGHIYSVKPNNFIQGFRCPNCTGKTMWNTKSFKEKIYEMYGDEYIVEGQYINNSTKIKLIHNVCGSIWNAIPKSILRGAKCPKCQRKLAALKRKQNIAEIKDMFTKEGYELLEKGFIYSNGKAKIKCPNGHITEIRIKHFKRGIRCGKCQGTHRLEYEYVKDFIEKEGYTLLSKEYKNANEKLEVKCPLNHYYKVKFGNFKSGRRCPVCNESKGEKKIRELLELRNIEFEMQKEFEGLIGLGGNNLRFDFALFDNNVLKLLIEYDGEFHYNKLYENDGHEIIVEHDKRKNIYCEQNSIPLLRIPYWEFDNIKQILLDELIKYKLIESES